MAMSKLIASVVPPLKTRVSESSAMEKALAKLMAERETYAKKNKGNWPTDAQLEASRKKR
jgi:hypothetical protein